MNPASPTPAERILAQLQQVQAERALRAVDAGLSARVAAVKAYQRDRFAHSHADLLSHPRYGDAARFFLDDLYGPQDFAERDAQFARIVPALVRLFPADIVATVESLAALHALSESLDSAMGRALAPATPISAASYAAAWQVVGRAQDRGNQIALVVALGRQLDRYTRNKLLRHSLRLMRGPARSAGLGTLQAFLERGFDTFGSMRGADDFLAQIEVRERSLMQALFEPEAVARATGGQGLLGQLP
jgi:hypothetical protein